MDIITGDKRLPRAVAFVDYEHWLFSLAHEYKLKPDIGAWLADLRNLKRLEDRKDRVVHPTFLRTVESTADYNGVDRELIQAALEKLIAMGYVVKREEYIGLSRTITAIRADWDAVALDGIWPGAPT